MLDLTLDHLIILDIFLNNKTFHFKIKVVVQNTCCLKSVVVLVASSCPLSEYYS